jgi:hypothetical protein
MPRFYLFGPRLFRGRIRLGVSFGAEDFRRLGLAGSVVIEVIKFVVAIPLALVIWFDLWILYQMI